MKGIVLGVSSPSISIVLNLDLILVMINVSSFFHDDLCNIFILFLCFLGCLMVNVMSLCTGPGINTIIMLNHSENVVLTNIQRRFPN
jgi:hypothetical protein